MFLVFCEGRDQNRDHDHRQKNPDHESSIRRKIANQIGSVRCYIAHKIGG